MKTATFKILDSLPFRHEIADLPTVTYDQWTLRCSLYFEANQTRHRVYVDFENVIGFRLLDNGNLLEFWQENSPNDWLLQIVEGGWFDLERIREGFVTGIMFESHQTENCPKEYLLASQNECINVICGDEPKFTIFST